MSFREAVDRDGQLFCGLAERRRRDELGTGVQNLLVNLIRHQIDAAPNAQIGDITECLRRINCAGRVGRRVDDHQLRLRGEIRLDLRRRSQKARGFGCRNDHRNSVRKLDLLGIGDPVRRRHDHFIAGVQHRLHQIIDGMLRSAGDNNLRASISQPIITLELRNNRIFEGHSTAGRRIFRVAPCQCRDGGIFDILRRVEVGFTRPEADDILALRFEGVGFGRDRQRRGRRGLNGA